MESYFVVKRSDPYFGSIGLIQIVRTRTTIKTLPEDTKKLLRLLKMLRIPILLKTLQTKPKQRGT